MSPSRRILHVVQHSTVGVPCAWRSSMPIPCSMARRTIPDAVLGVAAIAPGWCQFLGAGLRSLRRWSGGRGWVGRQRRAPVQHARHVRRSGERPALGAPAQSRPPVVGQAADPILWLRDCRSSIQEGRLTPMNPRFDGETYRADGPNGWSTPSSRLSRQSRQSVRGRREARAHPRCHRPPSM